MRNALFLLTILLFFSCSTKTKDDLIKESIESYALSVLNNPKSYEFVSLNLVRSTTYGDNIKYREEQFAKSIEYAQSSIESAKGMLNLIPSYSESIEIYEKEIERDKEILLAIKDIKNNIPIDHVVCYTYAFSFRAKNDFGATILNDFFVQVLNDENFTIENFTAKEDQISLNPGEFPGYIEAYDRISKKYE